MRCFFSNSGKTSSTAVAVLVVWIILLCCALAPIVSARKTRLTWVNGIGHNMQHMQEGQEQISVYFGGKPVQFCYNPTAMSHPDDILGYINDLTQAGTQKLGRITQEVSLLVKHLRTALKNVGKHGVVIHVAHSQGALITYLASKQLLPEEMKQMEMICFGGAAVLRKTPLTPFRRCINYYSINDPLLLVVPSAGQALRSGFIDDEFCFLAPRMGDPIEDHYLLNPTYAQALQWEGIRFQQQYTTPVQRTMRSVFLLFMAIWEAVRARVHELLKTVLRPVIIWCVFIYLVTRDVLEKTVSKMDHFLYQPILKMIRLLIESILDTKRRLRGELKFVPVAPHALLLSYPLDSSQSVMKN